VSRHLAALERAATLSDSVSLAASMPTRLIGGFFRWHGRRPTPGIGLSQVRKQKNKEYLTKKTMGDSPDDSVRWEARLRSWRKSRFWLPFWGPKPNEAGCFVPPALLQPLL
jgi:hypothetical protein